MESATADVGPAALRTGLVFNIMRFALHDGPGIRTTVFLKGCPLRCWWCHNPESQSAEPEIIHNEERCNQCGECVGACPHGALALEGGDAAAGAGPGVSAGPGRFAGPGADAAPAANADRTGVARLVHDADLCRRCGECAQVCPTEAQQLAGRWMTVSDVLTEVARDRIFFDQSGGGVTLSGGEPLLQPDFVEELLAGLRARRIRTTLDTSGLAQPEVLERIRPYVDLFLYDLKVMDGAAHLRYTGVKNDLILRNLELLADAGSKIVVRVPVIPGVNDGEDNLDAVSAFMAALGLRDINLLPYHRIGSDKYQRLHLAWRMQGVDPPSTRHMETLAARLTRAGLRVRIGG